MHKLLERLVAQQNVKLIELEKLIFLLKEYSNVTHDLLIWTVKYCDKNNIPIWIEENPKNLIEASIRIWKELDGVVNYIGNLSSDEFLQGSKSDEDLTEPDNEKA